MNENLNIKYTNIISLSIQLDAGKSETFILNLLVNSYKLHRMLDNLVNYECNQNTRWNC